MDVASYKVSSGKGKVKRQRRGGGFYTAPGREPRLPPSGHPRTVVRFFLEYEEFFTEMLLLVERETKKGGDNHNTIQQLMNFTMSDRQKYYRRSEVVVGGKRVRSAYADVPPLPSKEGGGVNFWTNASTSHKRLAKATKSNSAESIKLRGITDVIMETFCGGCGGRWFSSIPARSNSGGSFRGSCGLVGHKHGTRVHDQVDKITKALRHIGGCLGMQEFFNTYGKPIDPCVIGIFRFLRETRRIPFVAEHVIYDEYLRIHTPIDLICLEFKEDGAIHSNMIELKTGYDGPFLSHVDGDKYMSRSMEGTWFTPYQLTTLQILISMIICVSRYNFCPSQALILHIPKQDNHVPEIHTLPRWCHDKEKRDLIVQDLIETMPKAGRKWLQQFTDLVESKVIKGYK